MNMVNQSFENLAQRSLAYFLVTYPPFTSIHSTEASEVEQRNTYLFIKGIYERIYNDPSLLGLKDIPDDSFNDWEFHKTNPKLAVKIRDGIKKVDQFISLIFNICLSNKVNDNTFSVSKSDIEIKSTALKQLQKFDIQVKTTESEYLISFPIKADGLILLAKISKENIDSESGQQKASLLFSRGVFDAASPWTSEVFRNMFDGKEAFDKLMDFLIKNNYIRADGKENVSLNYIKNYGDVKEKLKSAWAERTHGGIEIVYEETRKNQQLISLRVPYFADILKNHDKMNDKVKSFVVNTTKKCDDCGYCVQTDKSGKRAKAYIMVDEFELCPLFCGFQYRWKKVDVTLAENMIEMLQFIDEIFHDRSAIR